MNMGYDIQNKDIFLWRIPDSYYKNVDNQMVDKKIRYDVPSFVFYLEKPDDYNPNAIHCFYYDNLYKGGWYRFCHLSMHYTVFFFLSLK